MVSTHPTIRRSSSCLASASALWKREAQLQGVYNIENSDLSRFCTALTSETVYFEKSSSGVRLMLSFNNFGSALVMIAGERLGEGWDSFPTFGDNNNLAEETEDRIDMEEMLGLRHKQLCFN